MSRLDDPALVAEEYADDARLRRRASAYTGAATAVDVRVPLVAAVVEAHPERVLEVGCGTGDLLAALKPKEGIGVDISPRLIEEARRKHPLIDFVVADAEPLDDDQSRGDPDTR